MTLSHDLVGEAQCVPRRVILPPQYLSITRSCKGSLRLHQIRPSPVPWGPPWLCFSEMRWIGQLKRLSSGWPTAIKSSLTGYRDVTKGRLYPRLIPQFIVIFSRAVRFACRSAEYLRFNAKFLLLARLCFVALENTLVSPWKKVADLFIHCVMCCPRPRRRNADVKLVEVMRVRPRLGAGKIGLL